MNDNQKTEDRVENDWMAVAGEMLPCLSIRQPWVWLILHAGKDIENRNWRTKVRGRILLHASKGCTRDEYENGQDPLWHCGGPTIELPPLADLPRGGIVGSVEIVDCVAVSASPWFAGRYGFVLRDPRPLPFVPWKGALGFFGVPRAALSDGHSATRFHTPTLPSNYPVSTR